MRRITDFSTPMTEVGMWAKVRIVVEGTEVDGILGRTSESYLCFASNSAKLDGNNEFSGYSEWESLISPYSNGWCIVSTDCGNNSLQDICCDRGFDYAGDISIIGVFTEDDRLVRPNGVTSSRRVEPIEDAMSFMHDKYSRDIIYSGVRGYHHHHGVTQNKPLKTVRGHKIGIELEVEFNSNSLKSDWSNMAKSNWFYCERDGSLNETGVEIITVPMNPKDIKSRETWEKVIGYLSGKAKSWDSSRCGLHVHVGREILGNNPETQSETIGKLLYLYHHFINGTLMNTKIFGRDRSYNENSGKTREGDAVAVLGSEVLKIKEIKEKVKKGVIDRSSSDRYFDINLQNTHTIEFRKGRGSIKASRIIMVIEYCEMLCKYAKSAKWEEISKEAFVDYVVNNVSKDSPLYRFFEAGERCDASF